MDYNVCPSANDVVGFWIMGGTSPPISGECAPDRALIVYSWQFSSKGPQVLKADRNVKTG